MRIWCRPRCRPRAAALTGVRHALLAVTAERLDRPDRDPRQLGRLRNRIAGHVAMADLRLHVFAVELPLARGTDGEAHRGTLEAGGRTVPVLGCGIEPDYPRATPSSRCGSASRAQSSRNTRRASSRLPGAFPQGKRRLAQRWGFGSTMRFASDAEIAKCCARVVSVWSWLPLIEKPLPRVPAKPVNPPGVPIAKEPNHLAI